MLRHRLFSFWRNYHRTRFKSHIKLLTLLMLFIKVKRLERESEESERKIKKHTERKNEYSLDSY